MRITILGCGNSTGVPVVGCECPVCRSDDPRNKRSRVSVHIMERNTGILIDTSPDLRLQALHNNIKQVNAVLYTHPHADHANGIDDLRAFNHLLGASIPAYGNTYTITELTSRFPYVFRPRAPQILYGASLTPHILPDHPANNFDFNEITITYFEQIHGKIKSLGYRIDKFAYSTDVNQLPEAAFAALEGVEVWLVDCLRYQEAYSHSHLEQTLQWVTRVNPRLAILTHMDHDMDYEALSKQLPSGVIPGYDGMILEL